MSFVFAPAPVASVPVVGKQERFAVHRIYCVGRNYEEHAKEMGFTGREPPFFFLKPADALVAYPRSLLPYPGRFHRLLGAARSARASGNDPLAVNYYAQLLSVGRGKSRAALLDEARSFVSTRR